ncbi:unnamed protein product [Oikopleura dioica]|uniref:Calponin-homology (CH) domain-containing protein n=1 Tax=Oikopleura dioica TaxID=34765 RepID=E4XNG7_OIKDI|nr:unnamed protein product [Oikopleura dioica]
MAPPTGARFAGKSRGSQAQWEETQRRTYTKWVNLYLSKRKPPIKLTDIVDDFKNGPEQMAKLLEILCGCRIDTESGRLSGQRSTSRIHQINIVQNALEALKQARPDINMVGINPSDIVDGKTSVVLGLIWRMVLNFQVQF